MRIQRITLTALALAFLAAGAPPLSAAPPDITVPAGSAIKTSTGKTAVWGAGTLNLSDADTVLQSGGKCAFTFTYTMINLGGPTAPAATFGNNLKTSAPAPAATVSHQTGLSLTDNAPHPITTQAYLHPGPGVLSLWLDDDGPAPNHQIKESNEGNNVFRVKYVVDSKCTGGGTTTGKPDLVIRSMKMEPTGKCAPHEAVYNAFIVMANVGTAPALPVAGQGMVQAMSVDHPGWGNGVEMTAPIAPGASASFTIPVYYLMADPGYMVSAPHKFKGIADPGNHSAESNETNNEFGPIPVPIPTGCRLLAPPIKK